MSSANHVDLSYTNGLVIKSYIKLMAVNKEIFPFDVVNI